MDGRHLCFLQTWTLVAAMGLSAAAQDFRVEADVFVDGTEESVAETLTLFKGDVVYDFFLKGPDEATVFDLNRGRIVLLDNSRQVQTTVTTEQLQQLSDLIRSAGSAKGNEQLFNPQTSPSFDEQAKIVMVASDRLTYRAKCIDPKLPDAAEKYRRFADWYARLNAVRPGNPPPFGRLELNAAVAERTLVPEEIERTVVLDRPLANKTMKARSRNIFLWSLSGTDQKRIEKASTNLAKFETVDLGRYWQANSVAKQDR
jgi:hypothetical protein